MAAHAPNLRPLVFLVALVVMGAAAPAPTPTPDAGARKKFIELKVKPTPQATRTPEPTATPTPTPSPTATPIPRRTRVTTPTPTPVGSTMKTTPAPQPTARPTPAKTAQPTRTPVPAVAPTPALDKTPSPVVTTAPETTAIRTPAPLRVTEENEARRLLSKATTLVEKNRREEAKDLLRQIGRDFPGTSIAPRALLQLAQIEDDLGETDLILTRIMAEYPDTEWAETALYRRGETAMMVSDYKYALSAFEKYLARNPRSKRIGNVRLQTAICDLKLGRPEDALKQLTQIQSSHPELAEQPSTLEAVAECHIEMDRCGPALEPLDALIRSHSNYPTIGRIHLLHALCLEDQGRFKEAVDEYEEIVRRFAKEGHAAIARMRLDDLRRPITMAGRRSPITPLDEEPAAAPSSAAPMPKTVSPVPAIVSETTTTTLTVRESGVVPLP